MLDRARRAAGGRRCRAVAEGRSRRPGRASTRWSRAIELLRARRRPSARRAAAARPRRRCWRSPASGRAPGWPRRWPKTTRCAAMVDAVAARTLDPWSAADALSGGDKMKRMTSLSLKMTSRGDLSSARVPRRVRPHQLGLFEVTFDLPAQSFSFDTSSGWKAPPGTGSRASPAPPINDCCTLGSPPASTAPRPRWSARRRSPATCAAEIPESVVTSHRFEDAGRPAVEPERPDAGESRSAASPTRRRTAPSTSICRRSTSTWRPTMASPIRPTRARSSAPCRRSRQDDQVRTAS